jgi:hypothetical protein
VVTGSNWDNVNNVWHEASRRFNSTKREYLKDKMNELAMNRTKNNIRDMYRDAKNLGVTW